MPRSPQRRGRARIRERPVDRRPTATQRGYDARWRKYRRAFLSLNALCRECGKHGRLTVATVVDHIVPHQGDPKLFWDRSNHQPLCHQCHSRKTVKEDGGFGHRRKERDGQDSEEG